MALLVQIWMHENVSAIHWKKNPVIIIVSPLLALMQDQVKNLSSLGFKAAFVGPEEDPGHRARDIYICLPFSRVCPYNGKVAKYARK